ncbi:hypothetical protein J437_LFUL015715 [Ladona fulva]|uniref:Beta-1,4-N-acetylgalactosaminyltransferase n=1 Tax=Ladona fulva TaxID=123851 RepID=A0A8K0P6W4_LADFU|nr:hypothetical protein J437_LFUL015715 [Ladona fulva]
MAPRIGSVHRASSEYLRKGVKARWPWDHCPWPGPFGYRFRSHSHSEKKNLVVPGCGGLDTSVKQGPGSCRVTRDRQLAGSGIAGMNSPMLSLLRLHLYKVLVMVVLALLALQYAFSTIFESRRFEPFFTIANHSTGRGGVDIDGAMDRNLKEMLPLLHKGIHPTLQASPVNTVEDSQASPALTSQSMTNSSDTSDNSSSNGVKQLNIVETSTESQVLCTNCETKVLNNVSSSSVTTSPPAGMLSCPPVPPNLVGPLEVTKRIPSVKELEKELEKLLGPDLGGLEAGGYGKPQNCKARDRVAVIVPYRDRAEHLRALLLNLHPLLQKQQVEYGIYVIEQAGNGPFNRAMLMNVGFLEASKMHEFDCFIFHDVDLLPEDDRNLYTCPAQPRHMSASIDVFKYK